MYKAAVTFMSIYLCLYCGKAFLSHVHILETNRIVGASSRELQAMKSTTLSQACCKRSIDTERLRLCL